MDQWPYLHLYSSDGKLLWSHQEPPLKWHDWGNRTWKCLGRNWQIILRFGHTKIILDTKKSYILLLQLPLFFPLYGTYSEIAWSTTRSSSWLIIFCHCFTTEESVPNYLKSYMTNHPGLFLCHALNKCLKLQMLCTG